MLKHAHRTPARRAAIGAAALLLAPASYAAATPPGENGDIAFRRYLGPDRMNGAIFMAAPDGAGERQLIRPPADATDDFPTSPPTAASAPSIAAP